MLHLKLHGLLIMVVVLKKGWGGVPKSSTAGKEGKIVPPLQSSCKCRGCDGLLRSLAVRRLKKK